MYRYIKKILFKFDPESVHNFLEKSLHFLQEYMPFTIPILKSCFTFEDERLHQNILGVLHKNPIGLAAGFDKNASMINALSAFGFGHIEFGTITPKPQSGNEKPRIFRYPEINSIQNAMGFNNKGADEVIKNLQKIMPFSLPLGASIGKNKVTLNENALGDYEILLKKLDGYCHFFVINISSPNTKGLRDLQNDEFIKKLFTSAKELTKKPIFLKLSPDLDIQEAKKLCEIALQNGASGIIATNTTQDYSLVEGAKDFGGLSGEILKKKSFHFFKQIAKEYHNKTTLISVGGVSSGIDAYERIKLGASLVQIYSSFIFKGPSMAKNINKEILSLMQKDGLTHISEAVGLAWKDRQKEEK